MTVHGRVLIEDIRHPIMKSIVDYLYTNDLHKMNPQTSLEMIIAADRFFLNELKEISVKYFCIDANDVLEVPNVLSVLEVSEACNGNQQYYL
jgi:hypothetical protein